MNDKKKKKEYVVPEADVVEFANEDVILTSNPFGAKDGGTNNGEWW